MRSAEFLSYIYIVLAIPVLIFICWRLVRLQSLALKIALLIYVLVQPVLCISIGSYADDYPLLMFLPPVLCGIFILGLRYFQVIGNSDTSSSNLLISASFLVSPVQYVLYKYIKMDFDASIFGDQYITFILFLGVIILPVYTFFQYALSSCILRSINESLDKRSSE